MPDIRPNALGQALRGFLADSLPCIRGLSRHTILSYRDSLKLLLLFLEQRLRRSAAALDFPDLSEDLLLAFLQHLESERGNCVATRNVRLAALHAFARYAGAHHPEHLARCQQILAIPFKRARQRLVEYLEADEMQALLHAPDRATAAGQRDHGLLLTLYNTGARVQEAIDLRPCDLQLDAPLQVLLRGKGRKQRRCPLWGQTATALRDLLRTNGVAETARQPLFRNRAGGPLTRAGVRYILRKHARTASVSVPALAAKRIHPHVIRHTSATHFLQAGVDLVTIGRWLGHADVATTSIYAEVDLETKRAAVEQARPVLDNGPDLTAWRSDASMLAWLESL